MEVGAREIFGPVLCIKRVKDFEQVPALYFSLPNGQRNVTVE